LFVPTIAFGDEGYFEDNYNRELKHEPTVCFFQPDDSRVDEKKWKIWMSDMKPAIETWRSILGSSSPDGYWGITIVDIPLDKQDMVNDQACDIKVYFTKTSLQNSPQALGWYSGFGNITILYTQSQICKTVLDSKYHIYQYGYCQTNLLERSKRMASVLQHEIGHAIGLSHYVSDNYELMQQWYDGDKGGFPSIMTFQPPNEELKKITPLDVNLVLKIYGSQGFGKKTNTSPVFNEPIIEPKQEPNVSDIQNIQVKPYQTTSTKITGYIPEKFYTRGTPVEFQVTKPDGTKESFATMVSSHQYFEYPMIFGSSSITGTYDILVIYKGEFIQKSAINISKSTSNTGQNLKTPNTYHTSGKYLERISITSDNNEYHVKSYLGKSSSPTLPIRITAENECPMKKQVFQNDFLFRTGDEVSFSFYQTNQGKPSKCTVYFSITDFNGNVLDSIKTSYELQPTNKKNPSTNQITKSGTQPTNNHVFTEQQKQVLTAQIDSTSISILQLKENMDTTWGYMMDARKNYKSTQAKEHIDKAWDIYNKLYYKRNNLVKNLDEIVADFFRLENNANSSNSGSFNDYINKLNSINSQTTKIESDTKYISQELDYAKKTEDKRNSTSKSGSQCFLSWC
jgi:hypothetical protein